MSCLLLQVVLFCMFVYSISNHPCPCTDDSNSSAVWGCVSSLHFLTPRMNGCLHLFLCYFGRYNKDIVVWSHLRNSMICALRVFVQTLKKRELIMLWAACLGYTKLVSQLLTSQKTLIHWCICSFGKQKR